VSMECEPLTEPDYAHWSRMARWEFRQAAALSIGLDPAALDAANHGGQGPLSPDLRARYAERFDLIENHVLAGRILHHVEPGVFLSWAKSNGISVPSKLANAVRTNGNRIADWPLENERLRAEQARDKGRIEALEAECEALRTAAPPPPQIGPELRPKERISLLKLCLGMAMDKYGYRPMSGNTPATARIVDALAKAQIRIDHDTVLHWLRQSVLEIEFHESESL
jgi:hypothetical protein